MRTMQCTSVEVRLILLDGEKSEEAIRAELRQRYRVAAKKKGLSLLDRFVYAFIGWTLTYDTIEKAVEYLTVRGEAEYIRRVWRSTHDYDPPKWRLTPYGRRLAIEHRTPPE